MHRRCLFGLLLFVCGCAPRLPTTYRLVNRASAPILVPPNVASADVSQRTFKSDIVAGRKPCPAAAGSVVAQRRGGHLRITVARDALAARPAGWLSDWTAEAESDGCVAAGEGSDLAARILESVPLDPAVGYRLLHAGNIRTGFVDLGPGERLEVRSPILVDGAKSAPAAESAKITGLNVDVRVDTSVLGIETAIYGLRAKANRAGFSIVPMSAVRHVRGVDETAAAPLANPLQFPPEASYYRLFYKAWAAQPGQEIDQSIIVLAGSGRADLDALTKELQADPNACDKSPRPMCHVIPRSVGMNPIIVVKVNSREVTLSAPATVGAAIRAAAVRNPDSVLAGLSVRKPFGGKLTPVEFEHSSPDILRLALNGGEEISWPQ